MKSLTLKMITSLGSLILIICVGLGVLSYVMAARVLEKTAESSLTDIARQGAKIVQSRVEGEFALLESFAAMHEINDPSVPINEKLSLLSTEVERTGITRMGIVDTNGVMKATDGTTLDIKDRAHFTKPMAGERYVSDPIYSKEDGSLILAYGVPIKHDNTIMGVLVAIKDGNILSEIVNDITFGKSGKAFMLNNTGVTIAHENKDLVINRENVTEKSKTDTKLVPLANLHQQMMARKTGAGEYAYNGVIKDMGFAPIEGTTWSIAIAASRDEVFSMLKSLQSSQIILSVIFLIAGFGLITLISISMARPIIRASTHLSIIANGDFTHAIQGRDEKRTDEIGVLSKSVKTMQSSVKDLIGGVIKEARSVSESVKVASTKMDALNEHIESVSATTEELAAGMEETAASSEEMNATSYEIEAAIDSIAGKAQDGALTAKEISMRANELKAKAIESQQGALTVYSDTQEKLRSAIEQSKAVEKIGVLSNSILQITAQTNLLALNAAIEAARAGEAGRGFTVVAEEIRKLAEESKKAVTEIQKVTEEVVTSVSNLSVSSQSILNFMDQTVLADYKSLVATGDQYNKDAEQVSGIMIDFSATSEQLAASIQNMIKIINGITQATNEGASGTSDIAQKVTSIVEAAGGVITQSNISRNSSDKLTELVSKFKV